MAIIQFKRGTTGPTGLTLGEPAWEYDDNRFYIGVTSSAVWVGAGITTGDVGVGSTLMIPTQSAVKSYIDTTTIPNTPNFITIGNSSILTNERALTGGNHILVSDGGVGDVVGLNWEYDPSRGYFELFDWNFRDSLSAVSSGGGLVFVSSGGAQGNPNIGLLTISIAGTGANGSSTSGTFDSLCFGQGKLIFETICRLSAVSDATNNYTVYFGFVDSITTPSLDGAYFVYNHTINSGRWSITTVSNGVSAGTYQVDSGFPVTGGVLNKFRIEGNSAGTQIDYYVNDTYIIGHTANIPTTNTSDRRFGYGYVAVSNPNRTGAATRTFNVDYTFVKLEDIR